MDKQSCSVCVCINRNNILRPLLHAFEILLKSRLALQITSQHRVITAHQQLRELDRPISQIATRQWPHLGLDCILHILVVVFLVPERSQQIQHLVARILALFSERVDETLVKFGEEVASMIQYVFRIFFQHCQVFRWWVSGFTFPMIRAVAQEIKAFLIVPEKGMVHDLQGVGAVFGPGSQHPMDETMGLYGIGTEKQAIEIGLLFFDVVFADLHPAFFVIERRATTSEDVVENAAQRKYVNGSLDALRDRVCRA
jgi:hypothetical protein